MKKEPKNVTKNKDALKKLGQRLRSLRKFKGYKTAEEAALKFEIQRSQYTRYESGNANINYLTLIELLDKMEISITDFFSEGFDEK